MLENFCDSKKLNWQLFHDPLAIRLSIVFKNTRLLLRSYLLLLFSYFQFLSAFFFCSLWDGCKVKITKIIFPGLVPPQYPTCCHREDWLKRQQAAALTNFVGCFLPALSCFSLLLLSTLNDLTGPSAGPLA